PRRTLPNPSCRTPVSAADGTLVWLLGHAHGTRLTAESPGAAHHFLTSSYTFSIASDDLAGGGTNRTVLRASSADAAKRNRSSSSSSSKRSSRGVSADHVRCLGGPAGGTIWLLHSRHLRLGSYDKTEGPCLRLKWLHESWRSCRR
ncbi:unnamed protein product, partial [Ectocarpus sp. 6 AP-2014]